MAEELKSDEERSEELKAWWRANGTSVAVGVAIAVAGVFGFQQWKQHNIDQSETASALFQKASTTETNKVAELNAVVENYSSTPYAALAALASAAETSQSDPAATIASLKTALDAKDKNVSDIATLRLARVYVAEGKLSEAETLLDTDLAVAYTSLVEEIKGDLFVAKNDLANARTAYDKAISSADGASIQYLQMKRDNLGTGA